MKFTATIILPAYDEEPAIGEVVREIRERYPDFKILVVDDGSTDRTAEEARAAGARVVRHPKNKGNGAAVKTGIRSADTDWVICMDADGQHDPAEIEKLLPYFEDHDLVVGVRDSSYKSSRHRRLANALYNSLAGYLTGRRIPDLTSGFRAFRRRVILAYLYLFPNTFSYPATSTLSLIKGGHDVAFVPVKVKRRLGKSKIQLLDDGINFLVIIFKIATLYSPIKIFFPLSFFFFLFGTVYLFYKIVNVGEFPNMPLFLLVTSVLIFVMGLISEQIAQLRFMFTERLEEEGLEDPPVRPEEDGTDGDGEGT